MSTVRRIFLNTVIAFLIATCVGKMISIFGSANVLRISDPLLGISNRSLLVIASALEIAAILGILFVKQELLKALILAWLCTLFMVYRMLVIALGVGNDNTCPCLGSITDLLGIPAKVAYDITGYVLLYSLVGSVLIIGSEMRKQMLLSKGK